MKKYFFEAQKKQLEKPTEPLYMYCAKARCIVKAETDAQAKKLAAAKLAEKYHGTGVVLGKVKLTKSVEIPEEWSYGYGKSAKTGKTSSINTIGKSYIK